MVAFAAGHFDPIAFANAALLGIMRMNFEHIFGMPRDVLGATRLRADVVLSENSPGGENQRKARRRAFIGRDIFGDRKRPLPRTNSPTCMTGVPVGRGIVAGPLNVNRGGRASRS